MWKVFADNQTVDVTPSATSTHTNYDFTVDATKLKLKILKGAQDHAGTKRKIWIGEKPTLSAVLEPANFGTLSNFQWTVTGIRQADYIATAMLGSNVPLTVLTQQNVTFAWTVASALETATVTAQLAGQTLTATARFEVMDATAQWFGLPTGVISVHQRQGVTMLGLGTFANRGITMLLTNGNVNGCPQWTFSWAQIGNSIWWRKDGGLQWNMNNGFGLDTKFPAGAWTSLHGVGFDSPSINLVNFDYETWRGNEFDAYLFFQPAPPSIPVAIKKFYWKWMGYTVNTNAPNNGWHQIIDPPPAPLSITNAVIAQNNSIVTTNPTWTNNTTNRVTMTTNQPPNLP